MSATRQHQSAFAQVSAYVVVNDQCEKVATVTLRHPKTPNGRLYAFIHWEGGEMRRGLASGADFKSDKVTAALANAARQATSANAIESAFWYALSLDGGRDWVAELATLSFRVLQAL
jgi:hypothetical protein